MLPVDTSPIATLVVTGKWGAVLRIILHAQELTVATTAILELFCQLFRGQTQEGKEIASPKHRGLTKILA